MMPGPHGRGLQSHWMFRVVRMVRSIEGLRGLAALLVALFHAYVYGRWGGAPGQWPVLQHAWLFVDLFFVVSGFIITRLLLLEHVATGRIRLGAFWLRRRGLA